MCAMCIIMVKPEIGRPKTFVNNLKFNINTNSVKMLRVHMYCFHFACLIYICPLLVLQLSSENPLKLDICGTSQQKVPYVD